MCSQQAPKGMACLDPAPSAHTAAAVPSSRSTCGFPSPSSCRGAGFPSARLPWLLLNQDASHTAPPRLAPAVWTASPAQASAARTAAPAPACQRLPGANRFPANSFKPFVSRLPLVRQLPMNNLLWNPGR